jgi:hypothetical protein
MTRLPVKKTYKLFIGGAFPRSESGRTYEAQGQNVARASRKDARDAVVAARGAQAKWAGATAYNRGQVLYRIAEMMESRVPEFAELCSGEDEVHRAIDRWVWYAGFADKLAQVLGSSNPVAGPYFNFTIPEPTGVVAVVAPDEPPLLGLVSRIAPALTGGNAVIAIASESQPLAAIELAEAIATADVPEAELLLVCGPRIDPAAIEPAEGMRVVGYVHDLFRTFACCDLAVVQGGLTTTMELVANRRPLISIPLRGHFEQNHHVAYRLRRYGAPEPTPYDGLTPATLAAQMGERLGTPVDYLPVASGGAGRAADLMLAATGL